MMNWGAADELIQQTMDLLALDGRISVITFIVRGSIDQTIV